MLEKNESEREREQKGTYGEGQEIHVTGGGARKFTESGKKFYRKSTADVIYK